MATKDNDPCRDKAGPNEEIFTIRSTDITGHIFPELWADVQRFIASRLQMGWTLAAAVEAVEDKINNLFADETVNGLTPKQEEAYAVSDRMKEYPTRKLAD